MVDHLLELGLGQIAAALAQAGSAEPPTIAPGNKPYSVHNCPANALGI